MRYIGTTLIFTTLFLMGCGSGSEEAKKVTITETKQIKAPVGSTQETTQYNQTMLFFLNPNGRPCQMQEEILNKISKQLKDKKVELKYVSTANLAEDGPIFQQFGVRALPTIIVLDNTGAEKKRLSPGVQGEAALLYAIN